MDKKLEIGKRIKQRRIELNMTQEELGDLLWLNKSTIQRYENGKISSIKIPVLHAMAKQLDVDPNWLALKTDIMGSFEPRSELYNENLNKEITQYNDNEKKLLLLARHLEKIPDDTRKRLIENFEDTVDTYLDALGIKKED